MWYHWCAGDNMNDLIVLKTNLIGGVERQQVINYITELQAQVQKNDCHSELEDAKLKTCSLSDEISFKETEIKQLQEKLEKLNSNEARLQAALNYIRSIPEKSFNLMFSDKNAKEVFEKLNNILLTNTSSADIVMPKLSALNKETEVIFKSLQNLKHKLEKLTFDDTAETPTLPIDDSNQEEVIEAVNIQNEAPAAENAETTDVQHVIIAETSDADLPGNIASEILQNDEEHEPICENSVDNFFAELEHLMNKEM